MRSVKLIALAAFSILLLWKGILPAFTTVGTDFANYYTSSHILLHDRASVGKLYDAQWFGQTAASLGSPRGAVFQPFPPPTALVMIPLLAFDMQTAKNIWTVLNIGILTAVVFVISRSSGLDFSLSLLLLLASGFALINNFYLGQVYLPMVLCLALSISYFQRGRDVPSGIWAGLFIPIKYFPLCLVFYFFLRQRWAAASSALLTAFAISCVSIVVMGLDIHRLFIDAILFQHLHGQMANPFSATYQSWNSLLRTVFVRDDVFNASPLIDWASGFDYLRAFLLVALTAVLMRAILNAKGSEANLPISIAALFAFTLLVAPATATYHFLLLFVPMALVTSQLVRRKQYTPLAFLLLLYAGMGATPAGALDRLYLHGAWRLLAYPRLYFLAAFFLIVTLMMRPGRAQAYLNRMHG